MKRIIGGVVVSIGLVLVVAVMATADDKKDSKGERLPSGWSKLGLTDEQKDKVYAIEGNYKPQIDALEKQIKELRHKEKQEMDGVLTDTQKARLKEILLDKAGLGDKPDKPEKPSKP